MRTCPSCGRENADSRDFCECGEYLRWEPTGHVEVAKPSAAGLGAEFAERPTGWPGRVHDPDVTLPPGAATVAAQHPETVGQRVTSHGGGPSAVAQAPPGAATLLLRLPDEESAAPGPVTVAVKPGERVIVLGLIRNESEIVDNYDFAVSGLPEGWWTVTPPTAYLVPYGTGGNYEQEIQVHVHPPRSPEAQAKLWSFEVVASSRAFEAPVASAPATVRIEPYQDVGAKLAPDRASGRLKARYKLTVRNRANAPAEVLLSAEDADGECQFRFAAPSVTIEAGRGVEAPLTVFPPKQIWIGRAKDRPIRVTASPAGTEQPSPPLPTTYRQKPWLPWWLSIVAPIAAALIALFILLQPHQAVVPNLETAGSMFDAEQKLIAAGLNPFPRVSYVTNSKFAGRIVRQAPAPGTKANHGATVIIQVARGTGLVNVPSIVGLTPLEADTKLRASGLRLGAVSPQPPTRDGKIASQRPAANARVRSGTLVAAFLQPAAAGSGGAHQLANTPRKAASLPRLGSNAMAAAEQLSQLGLVPEFVQWFSSSQPGTLLKMVPPTVKSAPVGSKVTLYVSAAYPELSYDDGSKVYVANGATPGSGTPLGPESSNPREEASWSADGTQHVYVQGPATSGQLMLIASKQGAPPQPLTDPTGDERDPAYAPNNEVLAFIDRSKGFGRLCFAVVNPPIPPLNTNDCTSHPGYDLGRQISWSHDGRAILVYGIDKNAGGLIEFRTTEPFTPHASAWDEGTLVTKPNQDVIAGAFSPDGKHLALVSDFERSAFYLFLAPSTLFDLADKRVHVTDVQACQVGWASDSHALAVQQAGGCGDPTTGTWLLGTIRVLDLDHLDQGQTIASNAENLAWQPVSLDG